MWINLQQKVVSLNRNESYHRILHSYLDLNTLKKTYIYSSFFDKPTIFSILDLKKLGFIQIFTYIVTIREILQ